MRVKHNQRKTETSATPLLFFLNHRSRSASLRHIFDKPMTTK